ncbi:hypothetical protein SNOG_12058 [Parastagonospora nodorum SN15]|uniref:Uncharacterized protein n=1 Tax=Phaeosphaeria nodorum (strain SN15 / ATCC MYA-4574 / FGSC 10173) TaxID=321614 RepID=Q0U856_PHANO|nr:hypothetical protein SNOG_12058 [Parastagonospora nodorum SN15]EAT80470.1 hypothetical protein SNOG_12058 [Parastagonospora nodorum SN15]
MDKADVAAKPSFPVSSSSTFIRKPAILSSLKDTQEHNAGLADNQRQSHHPIAGPYPEADSPPVT